MAKILLLGAGKSATVLIEELAKWEADGRVRSPSVIQTMNSSAPIRANHSAQPSME